MQRIAREPVTDANRHNPALTGYDDLVGILSRYLPPSTCQIFARPRQVGEEIHWYTDISGNAKPITSLDKEAIQQIQTDLSVRLQSVQALADRLSVDKEISETQARLLQQAATQPQAEHLLIINNAPLITFWGGAIPEPSETSQAKTKISKHAKKEARKGSLKWVLAILIILLLLGAIIGGGMGWLWWKYPPKTEKSVPPVDDVLVLPEK